MELKRTNPKPELPLPETCQEIPVNDDIITYAIRAERASIASELHDGICQNLAASLLLIGTGLETLANNRKNEELFKDAREIIANTLALTRNISHRLVDDPKEFNFLQSLQDLLKHMNKIGTISYVLQIKGHKKPLSNEVSINLYRIIQEFIHNSQKYSGASTIIISIHYYAHHVEFTMRDDGKGFNLKEIPKVKTFGLRSIITRIKNIHALYSFKAVDGKGVELVLDVPLEPTSA